MWIWVSSLNHLNRTFSFPSKPAFAQFLHIKWYYHPLTLSSQKPKSYSFPSSCSPLYPYTIPQEVLPILLFQIYITVVNSMPSSAQVSIITGQEYCNGHLPFSLLPTMILMLQSSFKTPNQLISVIQSRLPLALLVYHSWQNWESIHSVHFPFSVIQMRKPIRLQTT